MIPLLLVRNGGQTTVRLILKDVNDNAPQMPLRNSDYDVDENANEVRSANIKVKFFKINFPRIEYSFGRKILRS
jgi:hypothetical protein